MTTDTTQQYPDPTESLRDKAAQNALHRTAREAQQNTQQRRDELEEQLFERGEPLTDEQICELEEDADLCQVFSGKCEAFSHGVRAGVESR